MITSTDELRKAGMLDATQKKRMGELRQAKLLFESNLIEIIVEMKPSVIMWKMIDLEDPSKVSRFYYIWIVLSDCIY